MTQITNVRGDIANGVVSHYQVTMKFSMDSRHLRAINFFKWVIVAKLINQLINKFIKSIRGVFRGAMGAQPPPLNQ